MENSFSSSSQNPLILKKWLFLADKIEANPSLLEISLKNIHTWIEKKRISNTWALEEWRSIIESAQSSNKGMLELLTFLRSDSERARQLKSCSPFAGVLTRQERDQFSCAWTH